MSLGGRNLNYILRRGEKKLYGCYDYEAVVGTRQFNTVQMKVTLTIVQKSMD